MLIKNSQTQTDSAPRETDVLVLRAGISGLAAAAKKLYKKSSRVKTRLLKLNFDLFVIFPIHHFLKFDLAKWLALICSNMVAFDQL